jgi:glycosyltransferase involved in cell wall biosynthesis
VASNQEHLGPKVSICIPTYNGRDHLKECLDGVRAQTFTDFEAVICDDLSSDGTLEYARELAAGDSRFRLISNPKRFGLVGNWNNCIAQSRGEWIKFLFQDDVIAPTCIERLLMACEKTGKRFSFCARDFIFDETTSQKHREFLLFHQSTLDAWYLNKPTIEPVDIGKCAFVDPKFNPLGEPTVTLIHKSLFGSVGLFDDSLIQLCDSEFWFRLLSNYGAAWVPQRLATFRVHEKATTASNVNARLFRMHELDPLIVRYRFAFDTSFSNLRALRIAGLNEFSLRKECAKIAYRTKSEARRISRENPDLSQNFIQEWDAVAAVYPGLNWLANLGLAVQICHPMKEFVTAILARCGLARSK